MDKWDFYYEGPGGIVVNESHKEVGKLKVISEFQGRDSVGRFVPFERVEIHTPSGEIFPGYRRKVRSTDGPTTQWNIVLDGESREQEKSIATQDNGRAWPKADNE